MAPGGEEEEEFFLFIYFFFFLADFRLAGYYTNLDRRRCTRRFISMRPPAVRPVCVPAVIREIDCNRRHDLANPAAHRPRPKQMPCQWPVKESKVIFNQTTWSAL